MSHFGLMLWFAALVSVFFGTLLRHEARAAAKFSGKMFLIMTAASLALAWLMFFVP